MLRNKSQTNQHVQHTEISIWTQIQKHSQYLSDPDLTPRYMIKVHKVTKQQQQLKDQKYIDLLLRLRTYMHGHEERHRKKRYPQKVLTFCSSLSTTYLLVDLNFFQINF